MSSDYIAIQVEHVSKHYHTYDKPSDRLKQFLVPRAQRMVGLSPSVYFREFKALDDVSFEVRRGETVGIIGRNGSGKSTLLQIICGTLTPTSGRVVTRGRIAALLELGSGFNSEFTGRENVYLNASVLGLSKQEIDERFNDIIAFADIGDFIEQPVKTYSSGMVVRLAFAVIAHVDADILVVDEALAVGDAFFTQKCMRFLRDFMENGTILFVSHDTGAVVNLCNKGVLLHEGRIVLNDSPKVVAETYLAAAYESMESKSKSQDHDGRSKHKVYGAIEYSDMRQSLYNGSTLRNDIEVFEFKADQSGFGTGDAKIVSVTLLDEDNVPLSWIVGGENIILDIRCVAHKDIDRPIIGFQIKDRLGQIVFCDNTYLVYRDNPVMVSQGDVIYAKFAFRLPLLPTGDYSISPAIAMGTQEEHVQLHWLHDAMIFRVHASSIRMGLIGLSMKSIVMGVGDGL